jgi:hypothetical protein
MSASWWVKFEPTSLADVGCAAAIIVCGRTLDILTRRNV